VRDALVRLALGEQLSPTTAPTRAIAAPAGRLRVPLAYNRMMLRERLSTDAPIVLASPLAGTGLAVPMLDAIVLRLLTEVPEPEWPSWVTAFAAHHPIRLKVAERAVEDVGERRRILLAQVEPFRAARLPKLLELGIVEPAL
jgi:hypothetical protein